MKTVGKQFINADLIQSIEIGRNKRTGKFIVMIEGSDGAWRDIATRDTLDDAEQYAKSIAGKWAGAFIIESGGRK